MKLPCSIPSLMRPSPLGIIPRLLFLRTVPDTRNCSYAILAKCNDMTSAIETLKYDAPASNHSTLHWSFLCLRIPPDTLYDVTTATFLVLIFRGIHPMHREILQFSSFARSQENEFVSIPTLHSYIRLRCSTFLIAFQYLKGGNSYKPCPFKVASMCNGINALDTLDCASQMKLTSAHSHTKVSVSAIRMATIQCSFVEALHQSSLDGVRTRLQRRKHLNFLTTKHKLVQRRGLLTNFLL